MITFIEMILSFQLSFTFESYIIIHGCCVDGMVQYHVGMFPVFLG